MTYQEEAMRTANHDHESIYSRLMKREVLHALYRIHQEFAELGNRADALKKYIYYGQGQPPQSEEMLEHGLDDHLRSVLTQPTHIEILHGMLGLLTETRELWDVFEHMMSHYWVDEDNIGEELGDVQWYRSVIASALGLDLDDIDAANIKKLKQRYPDKFTEEKAINRDLDAEREALSSTNPGMYIWRSPLRSMPKYSQPQKIHFPPLPEPVEVIHVMSEYEDWEGFYVEGTLVVEGYSVDPIDLLNSFCHALGIETNNIYDERPEDWFRMHGDRCPFVYPYDEDDNGENTEE